MSYLDTANNILLSPTGLEVNDLQNVLDQMMGNSINRADLYFQTARQESWVLEDGIVKDGNYNIEQGVGVRAISGEKTGFSYSDEIVLPALNQAANTAKTIARAGQQNQVQAWKKYWPEIVPIPHPSPRNNIWLKKNPWFAKSLLPALAIAAKRAVEADHV